MKSNNFFLWPKANRLNWTNFSKKYKSSEEIETQVRVYFPNSYPVLFSSARAGLTAILQSQNISRPDHVWFPEYSSHCVIEAIGQVGTPTPVVSKNLKASIVYHQWGMVHSAKWGEMPRILIEDSVDSALIPNRSPFACGGLFTLWSLPKVLATIGGGVVFCRHEEDAENLRSIRARRSASLLQATLRLKAHSSLMASKYWNGGESMQGELVGPLRNQVSISLGAYAKLIEERINFFRKWSPKKLDAFLDSGRLPSNVPLWSSNDGLEALLKNGVLKAGVRNFNKSRSYPNSEWIPVIPFPTHLEITDTKMSEILNSIKLRGLDEHYVF
jgi:putative PLP-dependent aminotransferase (TIGR04422 family)